MPDAHLLQLELHSRPDGNHLLGGRQVAGVAQGQLRDVRVVPKLPCLRVDGQQPLVEKNAVGGLLGDQTVCQEVPKSKAFSETSDDLPELAGV